MAIWPGIGCTVVENASTTASRIAQCILYPSKGDRQDVCDDRSNTRSQRFSGPGLNAALISVHQSASPEPELSTPLGTVREELANFFENERLSIGVANTTSCLLQEIERSSEYNKLKKHATANC